MEPEIVLLRAVGLLVGVPAFLLGVLWLLDRLESWVVAPEERAAAVEALLDEAEQADEVEEAVTRLLAPVDRRRKRSRRRLLPPAWPPRQGAPASQEGTRPASPASPALPASPASPEGTSRQDLRRLEALAEADEALKEAAAKATAHGTDRSGDEQREQTPNGRSQAGAEAEDASAGASRRSGSA